MREAVQLAAGVGQNFALNGDGTVTSWGTGTEGGLGNSARLGEPVKVCAIGTSLRDCEQGGPYLQEVTAVASGLWFGLALLRDGRVVSWGYGRQGQLGVPSPRSRWRQKKQTTPPAMCASPKRARPPHASATSTWKG